MAVYQRELDYLFETLGRLGASPREIEDLAHEIFLVLLRNWADLDLSRPVRPYLFAIAFRVVCAFFHRRRRRHVRSRMRTWKPRTRPLAPRNRFNRRNRRSS